MQKINKRFIYFILMHAGFLVYSCYSLLGKKAAAQELFTITTLVIYGAVMAVMFVYAVIWQQVLKVIPLTIAIANKAITIVWGIILGYILYHEQIKANMIIGAVIIVAGIIILCTDKQ